MEKPSLAQSKIIPDNTLGTESSQVVNNFNGLPVEVITGGATRGLNLFHSFREFNVSEGRSAYFFSPSIDIQNILARVTGSNRSEILGRLGTFQVINGNLAGSNANLFLINPNGIIFGQNASLDLQGSFVVTTANGVRFGEQGIFSATNPEVPPLLTVNPSALLFNQINRSEIINRSHEISTPGSFYLIGGDITLDGGVAGSRGNRLELGAVAGTGTVELIGSGNQMQLVFPEGLPKADIVLQNNAFALTSGGGAISIHAGNLSLFRNSVITGIIAAREGTSGVAAGDVVVNAAGDVTLDSLSRISSSGLENSLGNTGNVAINAQSIRLTNQSQIGSNAPRSRGNIILKAKDNVSLDSNSSIDTSGISDSIGKSGDITIAARNINLSNQSTINSANLGQGQGGKITLKAQEAIALESDSNILSGSDASGFGQVNNQPSGDIEIKTGTLTLDGGKTSINSSNLDDGRGGNILILADNSLSIRDGARIRTYTVGKGKAGNLTIDAKDSIEAVGGSPSIPIIFTGALGSGDAGDITLKAQTINFSNQTIISSTNLGHGNAGNILVQAQGNFSANNNSLIVSNIGSPQGEQALGNVGSIEILARTVSFTNGSQLQAGFYSGSQGNAGLVSIKAQDTISFTGNSGIFNSGIFTNVESGAVGNGSDIQISARSVSLTDGAVLLASNAGQGNGGNIDINTQNLLVRDGARVSTTTLGSGRAGNLTVNASNKVQLIGTSINGSPSGLFASAETGSTGNAGDLRVNTQNLLVQDGAQIIASTFSSGKGGNLTVNASENVQLIGQSANQLPSGLFTSAELLSTGDAGDLRVNTQNLLVSNGAGVFVNSRGTGNAGIMTIKADRLRLDNKASINANTPSPNKDPNREQATINIGTQDLTLRHNSNITTNATGENVIGGNINIGTDLLLALENSRISANSDNSRGGQVIINAKTVFVGTQPSDVSKYITATSGVGLSGSVNVNSPDNSTIQNSLTELPTNAIDTNALIANSCIVRTRKQKGTFNITGAGGLPYRPGDAVLSSYPTGTVRSVLGDRTSGSWKKGDPIVEPTGVYRLPNGQLIMSRECQNN